MLTIEVEGDGAAATTVVDRLNCSPLPPAWAVWRVW